jgi:hypothetical protein
MDGSRVMTGLHGFSGGCNLSLFMSQFVHAGLSFRFQFLAYLGIAFRVTDVESIIRFWQSVYFMGHLSPLVFYILGILVVKPFINRFLPKVVAKEKLDKKINNVVNQHYIHKAIFSNSCQQS